MPGKAGVWGLGNVPLLNLDAGYMGVFAETRLSLHP